MPTKARSARISREPPVGTEHPPSWIKPQLAALVKEAPDGPDWLHELKLDGYRMHARLDAGRVNIRAGAECRDIPARSDYRHRRHLRDIDEISRRVGGHRLTAGGIFSISTLVPPSSNVEYWPKVDF